MMFLYWRLNEELKYLGEKLVFHDPSLIREYGKWTQKNAGALACLKGQTAPFASSFDFPIPPPSAN